MSDSISEKPLKPGFAKLDDCGDLFCGQSPSIAEVNQEGRGYPYFTGPEQWDGQHLHVDKWTEFPRRLVPGRCIFITVKGAGVGKLFPGAAGAIGRDIYAFRVHDEIEFQYVLYALQHSIDDVIRQAKGDIPGLSRGHIVGHPIFLPGRRQQRRIVSKIEELFSEIDKGIESLKAARAQLMGYRQSLLKQAFEGKLTARWRSVRNGKTESAETCLAEIREQREAAYREELRQYDQPAPGKTAGQKNELRARRPQPPPKSERIQVDELKELPQLPGEWAYVRLGELITAIEAGNSFRCDEREPRQGETGVAKVSAVTWGEYDETESKTCLDSTRVDPSILIRSGDFLLSRANTIELVGACVVVKNVTKSVMLSDKTLRLSFGGVNKIFYLHYLRSRMGRNEIERRSTGNQESMRNIGQDRIRNIIVPLCGSQEMEELVVRLDEMLNDASSLDGVITREIERISLMRQSILKMAFSGKLVPQDPDDEPVSMLLERIRLERETNTSKAKKSKQPAKGEAA
jgi:type I restriction enzyme S subunit